MLLEIERQIEQQIPGNSYGGVTRMRSPGGVLPAPLPPPVPRRAPQLRDRRRRYDASQSRL